MQVFAIICSAEIYVLLLLLSVVLCCTVEVIAVLGATNVHNSNIFYMIQAENSDSNCLCICIYLIIQIYIYMYIQLYIHHMCCECNVQPNRCTCLLKLAEIHLHFLFTHNYTHTSCFYFARCCFSSEKRIKTTKNKSTPENEKWSKICCM